MSGQAVQALLAAALCMWFFSAAFTVLAFRRDGLNRPLDNAARASLAAGALILAGLLAALWISLGRPPLRTLGETRLWYAFLLPLTGMILELRLKTRALRVPMLIFGMLFLAINIFSPETLDRTLMPALQSGWFVPHVVVYMIAYAALGLAAGAAAWSLFRCAIAGRAPEQADARLARLLVKLGIPFLTFGLCFGAIWAKEAWGHYWSWDPKETWSFITWVVYVMLVHVDLSGRSRPRRALLLAAAAFPVVLACWFLVNLLPSAAGSVHTYTQ